MLMYLQNEGPPHMHVGPPLVGYPLVFSGVPPSRRWMTTDASSEPRATVTVEHHRRRGQRRV